MKNLLALVGLAVVGFATAGWFWGWYKIAKQTDAKGHPQLNIQVNPEQIQNDINKVKQQVIKGVDIPSPPPMPPLPPTQQVPLPPGSTGQMPIAPAVSEMQFP